MTHDPSQPVLELYYAPRAPLQEKDLSTWAKESLPEYLSSALKDGLGFHFSALSWLQPLSAFVAFVFRIYTGQFRHHGLLMRQRD
jgi:hypothetical protein